MIQIWVSMLGVMGLDTDACMPIECGDTAGNLCMQYTSSRVIVGQCTSNKRCNYGATYLLTKPGDDWDNYACENTSEPFDCEFDTAFYPHGYKCCNNSNCASDLCENEICKGKDEGRACLISEECKAGYFCDLGFCRVEKQPGDLCTQDVECPAAYACEDTSGTCVRLLSKGEGDITSHAKFCMTKFLNLQTGTCDGLRLRVNGLVLESPYICEIGDVCQYEYRYGDGVHLSYKCPCNGVAGETRSHCYIIEGLDSVELYDIVRYDTSECSGTYRHELEPNYLAECDSISREEAVKFGDRQLERQFWPLKKSGAIDDCYSTVAVNEYEFGLDVALSVLVSFCLLI